MKKPKEVQVPLPTGLVCPKCGAEVPPTKLVCDCFRVDLDNEVERRSLQIFLHSGFLYVTQKTNHILPASKHCLTLCRKKRYQHPETKPIIKSSFEHASEKEKAAFCPACAKVVDAALQRANAGKPLPTSDNREEPQPQKKS